MPWQSAAQPQQPRPASPVPEGESVRLAALQATWKRDRQIGRRRLWWRWTIWCAQRYLLPAAAGLGLCAGLWFTAQATLAWLDAPSTAKTAKGSTPSSTLRLPQASINQPPAAATRQSQLDDPFPPLLDVDSNGMALAFEAGLPGTSPAPSSPPSGSSATLPDDAKNPNPHLISENWLHSKEP